MAKVDKYLKYAVQQRASDLHFSSGEQVRARIDGDLVPVEQAHQDSRALQEMLFEILSDQEKQKFLEHRNLDKSYGLEGVGNFRVNIFMTRRGVGAVLRTIPSKIPTLEELGLPEVARNLTNLEKGLVLVTGPTGSGKSTTLAAMLNHINEHEKYHILTAEDPIEFIHPCKQSLVNQREIGSNCPTFADALKYALREDPDVILVGEMRDLETIALALTAAETGHLVFGTLHTRGAGASVDRIIDSFPGNQQAMIRTMLSESLKAVISQALLKRAEGKGRIAAYEIMVVNHAIANLIREGKSFQIRSIMQTSRKDGMVLMDQYIKEMVDKGIVNADEAEAYMEEPSLIGGSKKIGGSTKAGSSGAGGVKASTFGSGHAAQGAGQATGAMPPRMVSGGGVMTKSAPPPIKAPPPQKKGSVTFAPLEIGEDTQSGLKLKKPPPHAANTAMGRHNLPAAAPALMPAAVAPQTARPIAKVASAGTVTTTTPAAKVASPDDFGDLDDLQVSSLTGVEEDVGMNGDIGQSEITKTGLKEMNLDDLSMPDEAFDTRVTEREPGTLEAPKTPLLKKKAG